MCIQVPEVCPLQDPINYTIEIVDDGGEVVTSASIQAVLNNSDGLVMAVFESGLVTNNTLTVRVTFVSSAMSWSTSVTHDVSKEVRLCKVELHLHYLCHPVVISDPPQITSDPPEVTTGPQTEIEGKYEQREVSLYNLECFFI